MSHGNVESDDIKELLSQVLPEHLSFIRFWAYIFRKQSILLVSYFVIIVQVSLLGTLQNIAGWNCYDTIANEGKSVWGCPNSN